MAIEPVASPGHPKLRITTERTCLDRDLTEVYDASHLATCYNGWWLVAQPDDVPSRWAFDGEAYQ